MRQPWIIPFVVALLVAASLSWVTAADATSDEALIRARLQGWADAFNARDAEAACDLFADDVIATVRGTPDSGKAEICGRLRHALAKPDQTMSYTPDIAEVLVSGDLAVVRLTWTLKVVRGGKVAFSQEKGMDLFKRDASGTWRILRFIAFATEKDD
ncbi:YybH family protein [Kaistia terrae]|uniref:Nuclear transport factor 2 family protein n=1 Tax=Kaistia terrae TaxID=537017 RepID=A0ABW0PRL9_9HYPH|nr:nuclear transport factor 2 family protein [Kaistia terrae]MCX5580175.1 nuclear transport factor 2 family protein [Kaistia terrae]